MRAALGSKSALSYRYNADNIDIPLAHGDRVTFGASALEVRATPGHTDGCLSFASAEHRMVFTGDALLVRGAGRTDFQAGDARRLFRSIQEQLFTLPDDCVVYPGHDYEGRTSSTIREERLFNPRIGGGAREEDFVGYMTNLALPHPKQIAVAVPANLRGGRPEGGDGPPPPLWGPVLRSYAGTPEINPEWVARHRAQVQILDVRAEDELCGELGALRDALHIPLDALRSRLAEVPVAKPVIVVCQTGRRSGLATTILEKAGLLEVANLSGGMVRWRELALPS
jgi:rhodanese-related sulfurtransferase